MGPRGHGLHCTKRHLQVLTLASAKDDKQGTQKSVKNWSRKRGISWLKAHLLSAARTSWSRSLPAHWWLCNHAIRGGRASHRTGQSNRNQFIPFLRDMQQFNVCYSQCINSSVVCLPTHTSVVWSCVCEREIEQFIEGHTGHIWFIWRWSEEKVTRVSALHQFNNKAK